MRSEFQGITFRDAAQAERGLSAILEPERPGLAASLAEALGEAADPCTVLVRLQRFLEAGINPRTELDVMAAAPRYARVLCTIFDQSEFLTDVVCRNPEYSLWLWEEAELASTVPREAMVREIVHRVRFVADFEAQCNAIRRFKRREILRIGARDIVVHGPLASITQDLSNLADATLEAALDSAWAQLSLKFGEPVSADDADNQRPTTFVILALGKLGGSELNFSSDIDLLFLYSEEGETTGGRSGTVSNAEFFHKLGELIIKAISELTPEGHVFRTDMRLRPHGRRAPLAVSLESALRYYEQAGQAWERQALIKVRPAAGDLELGQTFIERTRPFVFPRFFDDETLDDIRQMKQQLEEQVAGRGQTEIEVKLGRGGIRDIEFTVQMLQQLNGGRLLDLRTPNTLEALTALGEFGILEPLEASTLSRNYIFMRQVEHRLQIEGSRQRHALPGDPDALDEFARRLGYQNGASFMVEYRDRAEANREILERFLSTEGAGHLWVNDLLNPHSDGTAAVARLATMGFRDPVQARAELIQLHAGTREEPHTLHIREQFRRVAPTLLDALAGCSNPDTTLLRLGQILTKLRAPAAVYDLIRFNPDFASYLATLVSNSQYLSEILIRDPGLFETFGSASALEAPSARQALEEQLAHLTHAYEHEAALYRLRDGETLRVGMREILLDVPVTQIGQELTLLAEVCLADVVEKARTKVAERYGACATPFAVLGLGKLGGMEMGYGSDLDLVFVYDAGSGGGVGVSLTEYFAAVASSVIRTLKEPTRYGLLYDVDARLRPDGNKGMLTISTERLHEYYANEAQPWEQLALVKVRAVAGDAEFARRVENEARELAFSLPLDPENLEQIEEIRKKIVEHASPLDLKKHEGGIAEMEFIVRLLQIRHATDFPELKRADVLGALHLLEQRGLLDADAAHTVRDGYLLFRRIENRIRMMTGRSGSELPEDPEARADLARRLKLDSDPATLVADYRQRVHTIYEELRSQLLDR
ncbi:MAG: bifunctional [glutamate--ammonia ligase]-adenylyl-L-tyrosine phosphorylase/[glutamate--ammonia-ligase] adenylyltransferase [Candidatus Hydrogenedentes bacterium]|nr:bifunctional [glutamate--ammonia ligase]-adenylyl-L-tyrosine phosphorylase/[glutamate--ammonia-ligase] adenylyltransferase [Candidatus Hydrogenedentota bacterium]